MGPFDFFGGIFLQAFLTMDSAVMINLDIPRNFKMVISRQEKSLNVIKS